VESSIRNIRLLVFDFDGVFTDNSVYVFEDGREAVRCYRGDALGLRKVEAAGIATVVLSTETNPVVSARAKKIGIRAVQGCSEKSESLAALTREMGITLDQVAYVGNDINDLSCLRVVGLPIVVADSHPDVAPFASYTTRAEGGRGAVREVCDLFAGVLQGPARPRK
jgi:3-deoxy-D-manno-octulosonate 8-phosphate phosphatase (KDO 8-P phosphatase)